MSRAAFVLALAGTLTVLAVSLLPAAAQADPAVNCVDHKPATGFSFTCDTALAVPPDGVAYPEPDGRSFFIGLPPPDGNSTLTLTSFNVPGFACAIEALSSSDELGCSTSVAAGQTVTGTVTWKIGFSPQVPIGDCETGQLDGYTRDPGPGGEFDRRMPSFALQVCRSPSPASAASTKSKCKKKKHKRSAQVAKKSKKKCKKKKR
jgi:hypothetical protein